MMQRILITSESPDILLLLQMCLEEEGYEVISRSTSFQNVREIELDRLHLILLDAYFGFEQKGWQMLDLLLLDSATASLPVIIFATGEHQQKHYREYPHIHILSQFFDLEALLQKIKQIFDVIA